MELRVAAAIFLFVMHSAVAAAPVLKNRSIVSIVGLIPSGKGYGTGVCLDTPCQNVLTNYHVVGLMTTDIRVEGVQADHLSHFTGPNDLGATEVKAGFSMLRYARHKDLSLITLSKPLSSAYSGATFSKVLPVIGDVVTRSTLHKGTFETSTGKLVAADIALTTGSPLPGNYLLDVPSRHGNSGGVVLNTSGQVIGIISMAQVENSSEAERADDTRAVGTIMVGTELVSQFLKATNRDLWSSLFLSEPPKEISPKIQSELFETSTIANQAYTEPVLKGADHSQFVKKMRQKVTENRASISQVFANQGVKMWGGKTREWSHKFQVAMYTDGVKYRQLSKDGLSEEKELDYSIGPKTGIRPGDEWVELWQMLEQVHISYQGISTYLGDTVHVFQYWSGKEERGCSVGEVTGNNVTIHPVACHGVILTDEEFNPTLINRQMDSDQGVLKAMKTVAIYGPVSLQGKTQILPLRTELVAQFRATGKIYHAAEEWTDYHLFQAQSSLSFPTANTESEKKFTKNNSVFEQSSNLLPKHQQ